MTEENTQTENNDVNNFFGFDAPKVEPETEVEIEEEESQEEGETEQEDEQSEEAEDKEDEDDDSDKKPRNYDKRISKAVKQKNEAKEEARLAREEAKAIKAELEAMKQKVSNIDEGMKYVNPDYGKKPEKNIDDELTAIGINPDDYVSDGEKKLALENHQIKQQLAVDTYYRNIGEAVNNLNEGLEHVSTHHGEDVAEGIKHAVEIMIKHQADDIMIRNKSLTKAQATKQAYNDVMAYAYNEAHATKQNPISVLAITGHRLAEIKGIELRTAKKELNKSNNSDNVDLSRREQSQKRAGKTAINSSGNVAKPQIQIDAATKAFFGFA